MTLGPFYLGPDNSETNGIYYGDFFKQAQHIPDNSIDLCFTDPVYWQIDDYRRLAEVCARVLKPGGALLVWSNGKWHRINTNWLVDAGLTYRHDFACIISTGPAPMNGRIIAKTNRLIWLDLDGKSKMQSYLADGYISRQWSKIYQHGSWTKNPIYIRQAMSNFPGVVLDPFCGGGTVPAVCKQLGRRYLAFEIDHATATIARDRVRNTQPPLFVVQPKQLKMEEIA